jgi:hypothetical protein
MLATNQQIRIRKTSDRKRLEKKQNFVKIRDPEVMGATRMHLPFDAFGWSLSS